MNALALLAITFVGVVATGYWTTAEKQTRGASIYDYPYFASVEVDGKYACAGAIIDDKFIISTNSCVAGVDVNRLSVRVGTDKMGHRGQVFKVTWVAPYFYQGGHALPVITDKPDFAMLKLAVFLKYDPHVMWLNPNNDGVMDQLEGVVTGWSDKQKPGSPLEAAPVTVLSPETCSQTYQGILNITDSMFCLSPKDSSSKPCLADMGAPLYGQEQLYAVVTHSPGCSQPSLPVVVTTVSPFAIYIISTFCNITSLFG